ncbi:glycosyltransferase [Candidatus Omnitrophota bacterium]
MIQDPKDLPKVSVCLITYNHEKFIAQAIESVLMQKTDFDVEFIIGEDDSLDNTRSIVKGYKDRYPDKIKLFLNDRKDSIYVDGEKTGNRNFINNIEHARGKYIALLDGDDYWTSAHKLQRQADFLDSHPECAICYHDTMVVYEDGRQKNYPGSKQKEIATLEDLFIRGSYFCTCSTMLRAGLFGKLPGWFSTLSMLDWPLNILNAQHGAMGYINEIMGTYRVHSEGAWSRLTPERRVERQIQTYKHMDASLNFEHKRKLVKIGIARCHYTFTLVYENGNQLAKARMYALKYAIEHFFLYKHISHRQLFEMLLRLWAPPLYKLIRTLKK